MNRQTATQAHQQQPTATPAASGLLQRKCACGNHTMAGGKCEGCSKKKRMGLQTKLKINEPGDVYEQEADRVADQVMATPAHTGVSDTLPRIQRFAGQTTGRMEVPSSVNQVVASHGRSLEPALQQDMEQRFGHDFSRIRVHSGAASEKSARDVNAHAYTAGHDIVFGAGRFAPGTLEGRRLIAHELTHVVQQSGTDEIYTGQDNEKRGVSPNAPACGIVQRAISPELNEVESLLSYGLFDWAIRDKEAIRALEILQSLPKYQQAVFVSNKKYLERLRDNLPESRLSELELIIGGVSDITPPSAEVEDIRSKLSYGLFDWVVTDKEAIEALEQLKQLKGAELAVALGSINYGRLLDNLPDSRKQELIDLMAQGLGTGGARETEEKTHPGAEIGNIAFTSDHGVMKDNSEDWANSGSVVQPEWSVSADGKVVNKPISQGKGTSLSVDMSLNVLPLSAPVAPISVNGISDEPALNFSFEGSMQGGLKQSVKMTSTGNLPDAITVLRNKQVHWRMKWRDWYHDIGRSTHTIYVTIDKPRDPGEVTIKRMAKGIEIIEPLGTLVPHEIVKGIMKNWNVYDLSIPLHYPIWTFADDIAKGGQCIDIVRFVMSLIQIVGCPGDARAIVVWAKPEAPTVAIESPWGMGGMRSILSRVSASGRSQSATLLDGSYHSNNFEAALKFDHSGTLAYYPGGWDKIVATPDEVLRVFRCLAWVEFAGGLKCRIAEVPANYPDHYGGDTCAPGMVKTCYVKSK